MSGTFRIKERGVQILNLLKEFGPLSFRGIKQMLEPEIKDRRLHSALARFVQNKLIVKRFDKLFHGYGIFYQLSQCDASKTKLAQILNCEVKAISQPYFRSRDLLHAEACALWQYKLAKALPHAVALRDYQFRGSPFINELLLSSHDDFEILPDIVLQLGAEPGKVRINVAIEIERTLKAKRRLRDKLKKFADGTLLDGVIYVCETDEIKRAVSQSYQSSIKSRRVGQYGNHFLLLSDAGETSKSSNIGAVTTNQKPVSLKAWITVMQNTALALRRDQNFELRAVSCSQTVQK